MALLRCPSCVMDLARRGHGGDTVGARRGSLGCAAQVYLFDHLSAAVLNEPRSADFQVCRIAGFLTCGRPQIHRAPTAFGRRADFAALPTWKSAIQQTWKSALPPDGSGHVAGLMPRPTWHAGACFRSNLVHCEQSVKFWSTSKHPRWGGRLAVAGLMLVLWLGTFALTVSPELHHFLHPDAQRPDHNCLITQIQQHPLLAGFATITAPAPVPVAVEMVWRAEVQFVPACDYRLSPSRAPPFLFSSPTVVG